jgi:cytochrome b pre-mRNA-processing protein 3
MIFPLFRRPHGGDSIERLYGAIVAQARDPGFYAELGVPDTVGGRFEMIVLHVVLFFRRVRREPNPTKALGQAVFDRFCKDMEHNLREMGVSDLSLPTNMRRLGEAFYGRAASYEQGLAAGDEQALAAALARNVLAQDHPEAGDAARLAAYVCAAAAGLVRQDTAAFAQGIVRFPCPAAAPGEAPAAALREDL